MRIQFFNQFVHIFLQIYPPPPWGLLSQLWRPLFDIHKFRLVKDYLLLDFGSSSGYFVLSLDGLFSKSLSPIPSFD